VGIFVLWLSLDWPLGPLGAGYLASIHTVQFLLMALVAPPLLLQGLGPAALASLRQSSICYRGVEILTRPLVALVTFNAVVLLTHLPPVVDTLMRSQLGSFASDMSWVAAGLLFWWPVTKEVPPRPRFVPALRIGYLVLGMMFSPVMFGLAGFLVYSHTPLYGVYELAPPLGALSGMPDQQLAGVLMSVGPALVAFAGITAIFFSWSRTEG
jgi:putative membrane protein